MYIVNIFFINFLFDKNEIWINEFWKVLIE